MNFPSICTLIPGIQNFTVYIDNDMFDNTYVTQYEDHEGKKSDILNTEHLYLAIEFHFLGSKGLYSFGKYVDVYCNLDTAYGLVEHIDSWVSEKKIQQVQGRWPGK